MKIVIIPGVGYQNNDNDHNYLGKEIIKKLGCGEYEIFKWNHDPFFDPFKVSLIKMKNEYAEFRDRTHRDSLGYQSYRKYVVDVILDFQYALKYGQDIQIIPADYYIGHSAGSLFTIAQNKPSTIIGSPYGLAKYIPKEFMTSDLFMKKMASTSAEILNIINEYDILSYPVDDSRFENLYFSGNKFNPLTYFPLTAHLGYWRSTFVIKNIVDHIKKSCIISSNENK
jgi:hypothetical protein